MTKMQVKVENGSPMTATRVGVRLQISRVSTESGKTGVFIDSYLATIGVIPEEAFIVKVLSSLAKVTDSQMLNSQFPLNPKPSFSPVLWASSSSPLRF
jgi:hypothetical protein